MPNPPERPSAESFDSVQEAARWGGYWGGQGRDLLLGTSAGESFTGGGGDDRIEAGGGNDSVHGGAGRDVILAGDGDDFVTGDEGDDWLEGGAGRDTLYGGAGDDTLSGGAGDGDILSGGAGADTYIHRPGDGRDEIQGLNRAEGDRVDLTAWAPLLGGIDSLAGLVAAGRVAGTAQWGGDTLIRLSGTDVLTLRWINPRDLAESQFVFARPPANTAPTEIALSGTSLAESLPAGHAIGSLSGTDPEGDALAFTLLDDAGGAFRLAGDGVTLLANRSFDYEAGPRELSVTVRATDTGGLTLDRVFRIAITDLDEPVTAVADRYAAVENRALSVSGEQGVLANDLAPDGGKAAVAGTFATALGGTVLMRTNGSFLYMPKAHANGTDSFDYTLIDRDGSTATGTVTLEVAAVQYPITPVRLADIAAGKGGFAILGARPGSQLGQRVAAGDFNGDGYADLLIGASGDANSDAPGTDAHGAYIIRGHAAPATGQAAIALNAALPPHVTRLQVSQTPGFTGFALANAGDMDGDGIDDFAVGRVDGRGGVLIGFGTAALGDTYDLGGAPAWGRGMAIGQMDSGEGLGWRLAPAGDVNGDGLADLLIGTVQSSKAYLLYGSATPAATIDIDRLATGQGGFVLASTTTNVNFGFRVGAGGDLDGDGFADLLIGANGRFGLYYGDGAAPVGGVAVPQATILGEGTTILHADPTGIGDFDGDGQDDMAVGWSLNPVDLPTAGAAHIVLGGSRLADAGIAELVSQGRAIRIRAEAEGDRLGFAVSRGGDLNGDGLMDLLIGADGQDAGGADAGAAYVVFGRREAAGEILLSEIAAGRGGFKIIGERAGDLAGRSLTAVGDMNGDGLADLLVGAAGADHRGGGSGAAYLLYGQPEWQL